MRNTTKALALLCLVAALWGCDSGMGDTDAGPTGVCDGIDDGQDGVCPCPTAENAGRRYLFCLGEASWAQARDTCRELGYDLVRIDDQAEQDFVWTTATADIGRTDWWIGATDEGAEGEFVWADGSPVSFTAFAEGQPDQGGMEMEIEEDCLEIHEAEDGLWNDLACDVGYLDYICEGNL